MKRAKESKEVVLVLSCPLSKMGNNFSVRIIFTGMFLFCCDKQFNFNIFFKYLI